MQIEPSAATFAARYAAGDAQVVWTTLVADLETPVSAFLKIAGGRPMSFLLESVVHDCPCLYTYPVLPIEREYKYLRQILEGTFKIFEAFHGRFPLFSIA
jgi:hypothetical protein